MIDIWKKKLCKNIDTSYFAYQKETLTFLKEKTQTNIFNFCYETR